MELKTITNIANALSSLSGSLGSAAEIVDETRSMSQQEINDELYSMSIVDLRNVKSVNNITTSGIYKGYLIEGGVNDNDANSFVLIVLNDALSGTISQTMFAPGDAVDNYIPCVYVRNTRDNGTTWSEWTKNNGLQTIEWVDGTSNMNHYRTAGRYLIYGRNRTHATDNLPIFNTGSGHSFAAELTVLDSSLRPYDGSTPTEICVTQYLKLSNRTGMDGKQYVRTYYQDNGSTNDGSGTWTEWRALQGMVEKYAVTDTMTLKIDGTTEAGGMNAMTDNGMYSGIYADNFPLPTANTIETFALVVINDYAVQGSGITDAKNHCLQLKYASDVFRDSNVAADVASVKIRVGIMVDENYVWGDWQELVFSGDIDILAARIHALENKSLYKVVLSLPAEPASSDYDKIHLLADTEGTENNVYKEYLYVNGAWEELGTYVAGGGESSNTATYEEETGTLTLSNFTVA